MMSFTWSWFFILHAFLAHSGYAAQDVYNIHQFLPSHLKHAYHPVRAVSSTAGHPHPNAVAIALGVIFGVAAVFTLAFLFFLWKRKRATGDEEKGKPARTPGWWMLDTKGEKGSEWWKLDHDMPARVATPRTPAPKVSHLDKLRAIWSRNGKRPQSRQETSPIPIQLPPLSPSPIEYVEKPERAAPGPKPRYPSILERGYQDRVNLSPEAPRLPPIDTVPLFTDVDQSRRKVRIPPRALIVPPHGRPIPGLSERKQGTPNTPAHRRKSWLSRHHPFLPPKDPLTPTSAPVFSHHAYARTPTANPPQGWVVPRSSVVPEGPRPKGRRIPVPRFEEPRRAPPAPPLPTLPEDRVAPSTADPRMYAIMPPGLPASPYRRRQPAPI